MERVADQCADICEILSTVAGMAGQTASPRLLRMFGKARSMFAGALDAYLRRDAEAARTVCGMDDEVDALFSSSILDLCGQLEHHPSSVPSTGGFHVHCQIHRADRRSRHQHRGMGDFVETGIHPNLNDAVAPAMPAGEEKVLDKGPDEDI